MLETITWWRWKSRSFGERVRYVNANIPYLCIYQYFRIANLQYGFNLSHILYCQWQDSKLRLIGFIRCVKYHILSCIQSYLDPVQRSGIFKCRMLNKICSAVNSFSINPVKVMNSVDSVFIVNANWARRPFTGSVPPVSLLIFAEYVAQIRNPAPLIVDCFLAPMLSGCKSLSLISNYSSVLIHAIMYHI